MKNKYIVVFFCILFLGLSCYFLPFTWMSFKIHQKANLVSKDEHGNIDLKKKQSYLNSIWDKKVMYGYTYKQIKQKSLNFGLDLQGGMSFVVDVDIDQLIINLSKKKYRSQVTDLLKTIPYSLKIVSTQFVEEIEKQFINKNFDFSFVDCFENKNYGISIEKSKNIDVKKYLIKKINDSLTKTFDVVKARVDKNGITQPIINKLKGSRKIQIEIPGAHNEKQIKEILSNVGELQFWLDSENDTYSAIAESLNKIIEKDNLKNHKGEKIVFAKDFIVDSEDEDITDSILKRKDIQEILPENIFICKKTIDNQKNKEEEKKDDIAKKIKYFFLQTNEDGDPLLNGDVISDARPTIDNKGKQAIAIKMNSLGTKLWGKITGDNIGKTVVTTLDGKEIMSANISCQITRGETLITGNFTDEETKNLSMILKTGSLPTPIHIVEETIVGPGLSKNAQRQGLKSVLIAIIMIFLFMIFFYGRSGLIANIALFFNMIFILTGLAQINAVLTLTGIAGFILTLGMAIDANVLINERIKEELSLGKHIREALRIGYKKASNSIIDSNLTTFLTGVILYFYGYGSTKGFALTLMVGLVFSFFTSVYITRFIFYIKERSKGLKSMKFSLFSGDLLQNTNLNFIKLRFVAYAFSLLIFIVGGFCFWKSKGFNYGIDFTGGYNSIIKFDKKINPYDLQKHLANIFKETISVKEYGSENILKISMKMENFKDKQSAVNKLTSTITDFCNVKENNISEEKTQKEEKNDEKNNQFSVISIERVESSMADDIRKNSKTSLLLVLIILFFYIFIRFKKWQFGLATVLTLIHDILMIFAVYGIARYCGYIIEVNEVFITAILIIVGYTINNTVIIFDRIREYMSIKPLAEFDDNINLSINSTLRRTLITSFSTLMVVLIIFFFGGIVLEHFSFILLCGLFLGTYSSIFISATILKDLMPKKN